MLLYILSMGFTVTCQTLEQHIERLPATQYSLLNKFYRSHGSRMRISLPSEAWVVRNPTIIGGLCLTAVAEGYWLTGLFVAPEHRQQGLAQQLIKHIQTVYCASPIWLFCNPELIDFYQQTNFTIAEQLPEPLSHRLARYQQYKKLIALQYIR